MKRYLIAIALVSFSCNSVDYVEQESANSTDSILENSIKLSDSSKVVLELADEKAAEALEQVADKMDNYRSEISALKQTIKITKSTIIRDTVFITEKRNFWGKTKTSVDSSESIQDSTTHEEHF